ncbi:MAG: YciI family protein [Armatimonadetes bacterium]|nr:YciI family protein [Armatimonadota bacterium]
MSTADAKEIVTGFYVIRAASFDEAQAICEECPALQLGEFVEIREQMEY